MKYASYFDIFETFLLKMNFSDTSLYIECECIVKIRFDRNVLTMSEKSVELMHDSTVNDR